MLLILTQPLNYTQFMLSNLTGISQTVRKAAFWVTISLIIFMILRFLIGIAIQIYRASNRPPPAAPDVRFDKLPRPQFPETLKTSEGLKFSLQNIEGKPPETTASGNVYYMPKKFSTFESGDLTEKLASRMEFTLKPTIDSVYYYYTDPKDPLRTLFIDSVHLNFQLRYNYPENPQILKMKKIDSTEKAISDVRDYLIFNNLADDSLVNGKITTNLLRYNEENKNFEFASSLSSADAVRINYFRNDLNSLKIVPDEFDISYNYAIYSPTPGLNARNIIELSYIFWPIAADEFGSYPLITGAEAYQALTEGRATVIDRGRNNENVTIRNIYHAYYDSSHPQLYLQPIYVFEGDNDFVAYYPAVVPDWLE